jgi:hypothetical protein
VSLVSKVRRFSHCCRRPSATPAGPDAVAMRYFLSALPKGPTLQIKPRQAHIGPNGADNHFMVCHFVDGRHGLKPTSVVGGRADDICSCWVFLSLTYTGSRALQTRHPPANLPFAGRFEVVWDSHTQANGAMHSAAGNYFKICDNQIIRTSASANIELSCGGTYQIAVGIERVQKARLIGASIWLNSPQSIFAYEKCCLYCAIVSPKSHGTPR